MTGRGMDRQGLLTVGWFFTRNHFGGNTIRLGSDGTGLARPGRVWAVYSVMDLH